ncbi:hypothetical protein D3C75_827070 [compost metagenome]
MMIRLILNLRQRLLLLLLFTQQIHGQTGQRNHPGCAEYHRRRKKGGNAPRQHHQHKRYPQRNSRGKPPLDRLEPECIPVIRQIPAQLNLIGNGRLLIAVPACIRRVRAFCCGSLLHSGILRDR